MLGPMDSGAGYGSWRGIAKMRMTSPATFWQNRRVFVTGATGLLGSWLIPELVRRGSEVIILVRDAVPRSLLVRDGWMDRVTSVHGSFTDEGLVRRVLAEYSVSTVFHLGAQTLVGVAKSDPVGTLEANVRGTWTLLEAARQAGVGQFLLASSDKAYGESTKLPYREDYALEGRYPYEVSKSCADLIATMYARTYAVPVGIVRCGNLFGGGDLNFSRLIPGVIQATLRNESFLIRSDGKHIRDFLYVEDAADAYLCLAEKLAGDRKLVGQSFNFGLGLRLTMLDLVGKILNMMGRSELHPVVQNIASAEIREQYLDAEKAKRVLGWSPRCGMDEGLKRTIDWYRTFHGEHEPTVAELRALAAAR
jgi:CDP-glucose 4,6-dehydratase